MVFLPQLTCMPTASLGSPCSSAPWVLLALGKELTGRLKHHMERSSSSHLPTSAWLQEAVPHWRQGHVQREGVRVPELLPLPHQHQTHQDPWAQP